MIVTISNHHCDGKESPQQISDTEINPGQIAILNKWPEAFVIGEKTGIPHKVSALYLWVNYVIQPQEILALSYMDEMATIVKKGTIVSFTQTDMEGY